MNHSFSVRRRCASWTESVDMTSMVDVTFLLLIFFMVTASFTVQAVFQTPANREHSGSTAVVDPETPLEIHVNAFGECSIDCNGVIEFSSNKFEFRLLLKEVDHHRERKAVLIVSPECPHEKVIDALDVLVGEKIAVSIRMAAA